MPRAIEAPSRVPVFDAADDAAWRAHIEEHPEPDVSLALLLLVHSGADVGEVQSLVAGHIAWPRTPDGQIRLRFRRTKTYTPERWVPIPSWLGARARLHIDEFAVGRQERVVPRASDARLTRTHRRAASACGRSHLRLKDLRHVAARWWRRAGIDLQSVQGWLGHATITQT